MAAAPFRPLSEKSSEDEADGSYSLANNIASKRSSAAVDQFKAGPQKLPSITRSNESDRLPGIASLDEHMNTPWLQGLAAHRKEEKMMKDSIGPYAPQFDERIDSQASSHDIVLRRQYRGESPAGYGSPHLSPTSKRQGSPLIRIREHGLPLPSSYSSAHDLDYVSHSGMEHDAQRPVPYYGNLDSETRPSIRRWPSSSWEHPSSRAFVDSPYDEYRSSGGRSRNSSHSRQSGSYQGIDSHRSRITEHSSNYSAGPSLKTPASSLRSLSVSYPHEKNVTSSSASFSTRSHDGKTESYSSYYDDEIQSSPRHHPYSRASPTSEAAISGGGNATASSPPSNSRRRGKLPKPVTDLLKSWLLDHASHPYPTEDEKKRLCDATGLSISQVSNWFINARRRILVPTGSGNFGLNPTSSGSGTPHFRSQGHSPPPLSYHDTHMRDRSETHEPYGHHRFGEYDHPRPSHHHIIPSHQRRERATGMPYSSSSLPSHPYSGGHQPLEHYRRAYRDDHSGHYPRSAPHSPPS